MIPAEDARMMIRLARQAIDTTFSGERLVIPSGLKKYSEPRGVFVTLKKAGELRGCIGFPDPVFPLIDSVVKAAKAAAFEDPRFPELDKSELSELHIELSVLTVPKEIKTDILAHIKVGRVGLIVRMPPYSGLLLPQVPVELGWDESRFLSQTCVKAGLSPDSWKEENCKVFSFRAEVFEE